jgi:hypothetical protein
VALVGNGSFELLVWRLIGTEVVDVVGTLLDEVRVMMRISEGSLESLRGRGDIRGVAAFGKFFEYPGESVSKSWKMHSRELGLTSFVGVGATSEIVGSGLPGQISEA